MDAIVLAYFRESCVWVTARSGLKLVKVEQAAEKPVGRKAEAGLPRHISTETNAGWRRKAAATWFSASW